MTITTWNKEFYPTPAGKLLDATVEEALDHCIQKWVGLRPTNLKRHNLKASLQGGTVSPRYGASEFQVANATQCALCVKFYDDGCGKCPLNKGRADQDDGCYNQWKAFAFDGNPEKMIRALRTAKKKLGEQAPRPLTVVEQALAAMEQARVMVKEIATTGGKYGHQYGAIVVDANQAVYALRKAMERLTNG